MARQRFIWPSIWEDPDLAAISEGAMLLYIACFSLADDEGRLDADPVFLKAKAFPYRKCSTRRVSMWRTEVASACGSFRIYRAEGHEYIVFTNWSEFQKPKYPSPSKYPAPPDDSGRASGNDSPNDSGSDSGSRSGSDSSTGWVGLGKLKPRAVQGPPEDPAEEPDIEAAANANGALGDPLVKALVSNSLEEHETPTDDIPF